MQHVHACVHACLLPQESWIALDSMHMHGWYGSGIRCRPRTIVPLVLMANGMQALLAAWYVSLLGGAMWARVGSQGRYQVLDPQCGLIVRII